MSHKHQRRKGPTIADLRTGLLESPPQFSRYGSALLLFLTFCVVSLVGLFAIRDLRNADIEARKMYAGSMLGLHRIGDLQYETQETRRSTFYALSTADSNLQVKYADQSREADRRVSDGIAAYLVNARTPSEVETGKRLQRDWSAYLNIRDEVLASILEGSTKEAVDLDLTQGAPAFDRTRRDLAEIERLYDEQAFQQLANVDASSRRTIIRVAGVVAITLIAVIATVWTIQRMRMAGAIQLAKLQMEFVASVSHELRTPLAVISSAADNIADGLVSGKEDLKRYAGVLQNHSRQIAELVNQILQFASTQERKKRYTLRPLDVSEIIRAVVDSTREIIQAGGFTLEQQIEPDLPSVMGDLSALGQCLQNLVLNAVKYSGESRWIKISAAWCEPMEETRKEICIKVEDRGIGIDRSELPHIFDPFYRSPAVTSAQIHGTGLGLSVARNMAEAMRGRLSVVSQLGVGSVFTLHLPLAGEHRLQMAAYGLGPNAVIQK